MPTLELQESIIHYEHCGSGPPLLLLHGYPTNHKIWYPLAQLLSKHFTCVMPDLRGYGQSKVRDIDDINQFSKSAMAQDQISLMAHLGFEQFSVVGHDRGARVAYRLAFNYPNSVNTLTVMDIIPTYELIERFDWKSSLGAFHWSFCAAEDGWPESMIGNHPTDFLTRTINAWTGKGFEWEPSMVDSFQTDFSQNSVIRATCQDFRCTATVDYAEDQKYISSGLQINCPTMVLWGSSSFDEAKPSPLEIWSNWCNNLVGHSVNSGHFLPAENPQSCFFHLMNFLTT